MFASKKSFLYEKLYICMNVHKSFLGNTNIFHILPSLDYLRDNIYSIRTVLHNKMAEPEMQRFKTT